MNKYTCTMMAVSDIIYATVVAENEGQARELSMAEVPKQGISSGRARNWSVRLLEADVEGPARVIDCGHREA